MDAKRSATVVVVALLSLVTSLNAANKLIDVRTFGLVGDGLADNTVALQTLFTSATDGEEIYFPPGQYNASRGSSYVIDKSVVIQGYGAILQNVRLTLLADSEIHGITLSEIDCTTHVGNPGLCPVGIPLLTVGYIGHPIHRAVIKDVILSYTRAHTGIAMGYDAVENVTIDGFNIFDAEQSAISVYSGTHIRISNGSVHGASSLHSGDGIALSADYGPITDTIVRNVHAQSVSESLASANCVGPCRTYR